MPWREAEAGKAQSGRRCVGVRTARADKRTERLVEASGTKKDRPMAREEECGWRPDRGSRNDPSRGQTERRRKKLTSGRMNERK